jgi:hypothetical protein
MRHFWTNDWPMGNDCGIGVCTTGGLDVQIRPGHAVHKGVGRVPRRAIPPGREGKSAELLLNYSLHLTTIC